MDFTNKVFYLQKRINQLNNILITMQPHKLFENIQINLLRIDL